MDSRRKKKVEKEEEQKRKHTMQLKEKQNKT